jgi:hypothetical protein
MLLFKTQEPTRLTNGNFMFAGFKMPVDFNITETRMTGTGLGLGGGIGPHAAVTTAQSFWRSNRLSCEQTRRLRQ